VVRGSNSGVFDTERFEGYQDALKQAGIPFDNALVFDSVDAGYSEEGGEAMANLVLSLPLWQRPTALFCVSDQMAYGVVATLQKHGWKIPDDISIASFDDEYKAALIHPALTTLRQPYDQIGARAAERLVQLIEGDQGGRVDFLPGELIVRRSVSPPRQL